MGDGRRHANAADIRRALSLYRAADAILLIVLAAFAALFSAPV
jgi:cobalamin biosynthesis protein CobD/CbiB